MKDSFGTTSIKKKLNAVEKSINRVNRAMIRACEKNDFQMVSHFMCTNLGQFRGFTTILVFLNFKFHPSDRLKDFFYFFFYFLHLPNLV